MHFLRLLVIVGVSRLAESYRHHLVPSVRPPSFRRAPTLIECRDGSSRPLINASATDVSTLRQIHPHCPFSVLEFKTTLPHCPDVAFCPREFRAISPCGDCCYVCREPNEDYMEENAATSANVSLPTTPKNTPGPCQNIKCKRYQKCVLNIQGLPVCRCFPVGMCSSDALPAAIVGKKRKEKKAEKEVCGSDGVSYESKCHMHVAACQAQTHIRTAHKGSCMKPAQSPKRQEPSIKLKPSKGNRKHNRLSSSSTNRRFLTSAITTTTSPPQQSVVASSGLLPSHPKPAIIVPIISPSSFNEGREGRDRGRKQQGASNRGRSNIGDSSSSSSGNRDPTIVSIVKAHSGGRKTGRREKTSRSERPRGERTRLERPGRNKSLKHERNDNRGNSGRESDRAVEQQLTAGKLARNPHQDGPERSRLDKDVRLKLTNAEYQKPEFPKANKKIKRLERKKLKLEKRLQKEKKKVMRKQS